MRRSLETLTVVCALLAGQTAQAQQDGGLETMREAFSYYVGTQIARELSQRKIDPSDIDFEAFRLGSDTTRDGIGHNYHYGIDLETRVEVLNHWRGMGSWNDMPQSPETASRIGAAFLERNEERPGVLTTASGLQYKAIEGTGPRPNPSQSVTIRYKGHLLDGTVINRDGGKRVAFDIGDLVPGLQEALLLMPLEAKHDVWISADLAYGERGAGDLIGPNQVLRYTIDLHDII